MNKSTDAILIYNRAGEPVRVSEKVISAYGFDPTRSTRREALERLNIRTRDGKTIAFDELPTTRALQGERVKDSIYLFQNVQGQDVSIEVSASPIWADDEVVGMVAIWHDVTEREDLLTRNQNQKEELNRQRSLIETMMQDAPIGIGLLEGPEHRYSMANTALRQIFKTHGKQDVMGKPIAEVWPETHNLYVPLLNRVYQAGVPARLTDVPIPIETPGGITTRYYTSLYIPLFDSEGHTYCILGMTLDTTLEVTAQVTAEEERDRLQTLLESMSDEVWFCDLNGSINLMNDHAAQDLGISDPELINGPLQENLYQHIEVFHVDGSPRPVDETPLLRSLKGEKVRGQEIIRNIHTGELRYREFSSAPIHSTDGKISGAVAVAHDITDQKKAEEELRLIEAQRRESEARFRSLLENSLDLAYRRNLLTDQYDYISPASSQILGFTPEEMASMSTEEALQRIHPDDLEMVLEDMKQADREGKGRLTYRFLHKNGQYCWLSDYLTVIKDENGKPLYRAGITRDISTQKETEAELRAREEKLRESEERFRALANNIPQMAWMADENGNIFWYNQRWFDYTGADLPDVNGWGWIALLHPEHKDEVVEKLKQSFENGEAWEDMFTIRSKEGQFRWFLSRAVPIRDENGSVTRWFGTHTDVTRQREVEDTLKSYMQELEQSNRDLEQFAFFASHDLQEPLRKIHFFGDNLVNRLQGKLGEEEQDFFDRMLNASNRLQVMIDDLLTLSRVNTRAQPFEEVDLNLRLEEALSDLEGAIARTKAQVTVEPLPPIQGDPSQIRMLLENLIANAIKFHKPNQTPEVRVWGELLPAKGKKGPWLALSVEDNGIGFDMKYEGRILEPFQRLHGRSEYEGTGIGLAICKRITERHHGSIRAKSEVGKGATFTVTLPIKQPKGK